MIGDSFFGATETGYGEVDEFEYAVGTLNGHGVRWPGGTLAETRTDIYDLNFPDLFDPSALFSGSGNLVRSGLSDVLDRASNTGEPLTVILPTARYADDIEQGVADVMSFLDRLFVGQYGELPENLTLEIGSEYFALDEFRDTPELYGQLASRFTEVLAGKALEYGDQLANVELQVAVQMGKTHGDNAEILNSFSKDALSSIDLLVYHYGPINLKNLNSGSNSSDIEDQGIGRVERTENYLDAWKTAINATGVSAGEVHPYMSAWAVGAPANDPSDVDLTFQDYGARGASLGLETLVGAVSLGTVSANVWGVDAPNLSTLIEVEEVGETFATAHTHFGTFFSLAAAYLPELTYAQPFAENHRSEDFNAHVFSSDGHIAVFAYVNDIHSPAAFDLTFSGLDAEVEPGPDVEIERFYNIGTDISSDYTGDPEAIEVRLFERPVLSFNGDVSTTINATGISDLEFISDYELILLTASWTYDLSSGDDLHSATRYDDSVRAGTGDDTVDGFDGDDWIEGGDGNDVLYGGTQEDRLYGGEGDDTLYGGAGFDRLEGGPGNDILFGGNQADNLLGGHGNDVMWGEGGFDRLFGGDGDDWGDGGDGPDALFGERGNDTLNGGEGEDRLFGGVGNDMLSGGPGDDNLQGGAGFDVLDGGVGNDILTGNFNADTFVFADNHGEDVITDFEATNSFEKIDLSGVTSIEDFSDLVATHLYEEGADSVIETGGGNWITLIGVSLGDLDGSDFLF